MRHVTTVLLVGGGGFIGANLRYWLGGWIQDRAGVSFPWQTLAVNLSGCLLIGLLLGLAAGLNLHNNWKLFLAIGVLGGYTTYSTFAWESISLLSEGQFSRATYYVVGTAVGAVMAAWIGLVIARLMLGGRA